MTTPPSSIALVLTASFIGSFGAVFLKSGSQRLRNGWRHILNWNLAAGVALFVLSSLFFVQGIRVGELSVLYPMVSLGYIWTLLWSRLIFGEPLSRGKFAGLALIVLGVFFVGLGGR
ncbi:MAG TPA: EamA family transporter [Bryobacteraceae bacterium]|nr:EamA family transporter [Bryobacteraceae bacterium]